MGNKASLKAKLKAADRRRKRRPEVTAAPSTENTTRSSHSTSSDNKSSTDTANHDPTDLITAAILKHVNNPQNSAKDAFVITTLRGLLRGSSPSSDEAVELCQQLENIALRDDIDRRKFRSSIENILAIAQQQRTNSVPDAFLQYLTILAN